MKFSSFFGQNFDWKFNNCILSWSKTNLYRFVMSKWLSLIGIACERVCTNNNPFWKKSTLLTFPLSFLSFSRISPICIVFHSSIVLGTSHHVSFHKTCRVDAMKEENITQLKIITTTDCWCLWAPAAHSSCHLCSMMAHTTALLTNVLIIIPSLLDDDARNLFWLGNKVFLVIISFLTCSFHLRNQSSKKVIIA